LLGLAYFAGKLQNKINQLQINAQSEYENELDTWWETLEGESWSSDQIRKAGVVGLEEKHNLIVELFNARIEDLQRKIDSLLVNPMRKPDLRKRKEKVEGILSEIERLKVKTTKIRALKSYVDTRIGRKLPSLISENQQKIVGVGPLCRVCPQDGCTSAVCAEKAVIKSWKRQAFKPCIIPGVA
jgi:predicted transcriptional regulator